MSHWNQDQLTHLADILMAAADADRETVRAERTAVEAILTEQGGGTLASSLAARLKDFDRARFDLGVAAKGLGALDEAHRREVLTLVARVTDSDEVHDLDESEFIVRVARALGAPQEEYKGLIVELKSLSKPPPVPRKP